MRKESTYDILLDYLTQRNNGTLDSKSIDKCLQNIGKDVDQIHEILVEFIDEWEREQLHQTELKRAKRSFSRGIVITVMMITVNLLFALGFFPVRGISILLYGAVAAGMFMTIWGWNTLRRSKMRDDRLKIKYQNW